MLILSVGGIILMLFFVTYSSQRHNLNSIKDKTVGNGQHGTARWATQQEIKRIYNHVPFTPELWRQEAREGRQPTANGKALPQGIVLGSKGMKTTTALVDSDDVHVMMIGASGVGKTAYFLYPNLEYACASGMSFLALDTKGDLARNYGAIARDIYGYRISVVDLREPTRSDGNNLLTLINRYMDKHREDPKDIGAKAKAESTQRSSPRPSSTRRVTAPTVARTPTSMTRQRVCWHRSFCCWRNSCPRRKQAGMRCGISPPCSSWFRSFWHKVLPGEGATSFRN